MKRIVKGLLYDTDKATQIHIDPLSRSRLYVTPEGRFFTMYPNGEIVPKTEENAKIYLGARDVDMYIKLFGEVEEA